ncbi:DUF4011 domain-containing protein [Mycoplasma zalophi]|uniref:DUF4011 domain-containing protein n=1 Tax=Mycoplasma zalophi TaxID=191287 RepID=UPI001C10F384|nr:DUF4011 domain-containing protein [Mycoplasma zalophi]MBU4691219.1 DUF4011 domain-containing protein [Mycoplasma zalophi]
MNRDKIIKSTETWKGDLLDLSLRNKALNYSFNPSKNLSRLKIISPDLNQILNIIEDKKSFEIANINYKNENTEDSKIIKHYNYNDLLLVENSLKENVFYSDIDKKDQVNVLKKISKKYLDFIDQYSINTLFLAVGLLKWREEESDLNYYSPLMFIQTKLKSKKNIKENSAFNLIFNEESILIPNITLIKKLNYSFGIKINIEELEQAETNIEKYNLIKQILKQHFQDENWGFIDNVYLDTFSFSKINIFADLEQNENKIINSKFIQSMLGEEIQKEPFDVINESNVEEKIDINNYYHILDSDSSQEVAIQSAIQGQSFILQGPPGTGKSHTITNIITELLARNKKILFVAEKKAALDVVYNNLDKIGLSDYSIPIHSIDLNKKEVLKNLADSLTKGENKLIIDQNSSQNLVHNYKKTVDYLSKYGKELLQLRKPLNISLYRLIGKYYTLKQTKDLLFAINNLESINSQKLEDLKITINEFETCCQYFNFNVSNNPWWGSKWTKINIQEKEEIIQKLNSISTLAQDVYKKILSVHKSITINDQSFAKNITYLKDIFEQILNLNIKIDEKILYLNNIDDEIEKYDLLLLTLKEYKELENNLSGIFDLKITQTNVNKFVQNYKEKYKNPLRFLSVKWSFVNKILKKFSKSKDKNLIHNNLDNLLKFKSLDNKLNEIKNTLNFAPGILEINNLKDIQLSLKLISSINKYNVISDFTIDKIKLTQIVNLDIRYKNDIEETLELINKFLDNLDYISSNFEKNIFDFDTLSIPQLKEKLTFLNNTHNDLGMMVRINKVKSELNDLELADFYTKILEAKITKNFYNVFIKRFYKLIIDTIITKDMQEFNDSSLETFRDMFINVEQNVKELAKAKVEANLLNNIPNSNGLNSQNIEIKILKAEANKSRNIMPFKKIFEKIPNLLLQLKPCLMMSPLSVSAYLKDANIEFDTVIFDEASQVKPETAIGAIYRAKQIIIVGDSEQLPPTNFFNLIDQDNEITEDDDDSVSIKGFDSILNMANISLNTIKLRWHYRSVFEELIYPSNREIYNNLITFPSKLKPKEFEGINKIYVNGLFVERKNEKEADEVIKTIEKIILNYGVESSVGVVTFNQEQQLHIEKKIDKFKQKFPQYSEFFSREKEDNFFVKNIETVQGDEREFIIISSVYGPDLNNKISMRFGPINNENGYKRLNVAFTRAKRGVILVSSLKSEDIDLNRAEGRGVKFLKTYLETAEFGINPLIDNNDDIIEFDSPFEEEVYNELNRLGYKVKTQVGSSGYRIDLAIVDPNNPNNYILGIECDGSTYHSSKTARDRDRLRQEVLEKRGWTIHRIWSTDWFTNKSNQLNKIKNVLKSINIHPNKRQIANKVENHLFSVVKKEETKIEFLTLPDFDDEYLFSNVLSNSNASYATDKLKELITEYQVLHISHIKKILTFIFNRKVYSSYVQDFANRIFSLLKKENFVFNEDFIIAPDIDKNTIKFKKATKRSPETVYYFEFVDLILRIINSVKIIDQNSLMRLIISYLGYTSLNTTTKQFLENVLDKMVQENLIIYEKESDIYKSL